MTDDYLGKIIYNRYLNEIAKEYAVLYLNGAIDTLNLKIKR
jgi:hypothetical protein